MNRKMNRTILRKQYDKFCDAWKNEKMYQRIATENGGQLPEGQQLLGKKPTFSMWMTAVKNQVFTQHVPAEDKSVGVVDAAWEE